MGRFADIKLVQKRVKNVYEYKHLFMDEKEAEFRQTNHERTDFLVFNQWRSCETFVGGAKR